MISCIVLNSHRQRNSSGEWRLSCAAGDRSDDGHTDEATFAGLHEFLRLSRKMAQRRESARMLSHLRSTPSDRNQRTSFPHAEHAELGVSADPIPAPP
jgi:hypothetical protein